MSSIPTAHVNHASIAGRGGERESKVKVRLKTLSLALNVRKESFELFSGKKGSFAGANALRLQTRQALALTTNSSSTSLRMTPRPLSLQVLLLLF